MPATDSAPIASVQTDEPDPGRPTALLPLSQLVRLSVYWLGLVAVVQGIGIILQERITVLVPDPSVQYTTLGVMQVAGMVIAVLVQPTVGTLSDYTVSRFGRRKPYIVIGTVLDLVFLVGLATSNTVLAVAAFVTLLQFSSNFAQGPFQGYVPDLVAAPQVGLASGMVGLFTVLGVVTGTAIATVGIATGELRAADHRPGPGPRRHDGPARLPPQRGPRCEAPRGPELAVHRRRGVGERTSCASAASCTSSRPASSSSAAAPSSSCSRCRTSSARWA